MEIRCAVDSNLTKWGPPEFIYPLYFYRGLPYDPVRPWRETGPERGSIFGSLFGAMPTAKRRRSRSNATAASETSWVRRIFGHLPSRPRVPGGSPSACTEISKQSARPGGDGKWYSSWSTDGCNATTRKVLCADMCADMRTDMRIDVGIEMRIDDHQVPSHVGSSS